MPCIHSSASFIVGIGHPRCGTGFTASLIQTSGLDVKHERVGKDGIVSWMLPGGQYRNPFGDAIGPLNDFRNVFCVTRSPLQAIPSIIPENNHGASLRFRRRILRGHFGENCIKNPRANRVRAAVETYTKWFELCLSFKPSLIFRVDVPEDDLLLSNLVGAEITRSDGVHRNSRPRIRSTNFSPTDLINIDRDLTSRLADISRKLGYIEDAEVIEKTCEAPSIVPS